MLTGTAIMALDTLQKDFKLTDRDILEALLQKRGIECRTDPLGSLVLSLPEEEIVEMFFHLGQLERIEVLR